MRRFVGEWSLRHEMPTGHRQRTSVDKRGIDIARRCGRAGLSGRVSVATSAEDTTPSSARIQHIFTTKPGLACDGQRQADKLDTRCDVDIGELHAQPQDTTTTIK